MQRTEAILLMIALLATPLSLLARASSAMTGECNNMCCLLHGPHSAHSHSPAASAKEEGMTCHHGDAGHLMRCSMKAGHHNMDYGFFASIAPTAPSAFVRMSSPNQSRAAFTPSIDSLLPGFTAPPFQPPRS